MTTMLFSHKLLVPNDQMIKSADGYAEEMNGATEFELTQNEYDFLRAPCGLFEIFDQEYGTLIDDCEEDRIENDNIIKAIDTTAHYSRSFLNTVHAINVVMSALQLAKNRNVFCEISNRPLIKQ